MPGRSRMVSIARVESVFELSGRNSELTYMKIFALKRTSYGDEFAEAITRGTINHGPYCEVCHTYSFASRESPLVIEWTVDKWKPGSQVIADFTWCSIYDILTTQRVRDTCEGQFTGIEFGPVEMIQDPKLKKPKRVTSRTKRRVWLPYEGPPLWDLKVTSSCHLDPEKSGRTISVCPGCGYKSIQVAPNSRIVIPMDQWIGTNFFIIEEVGRTVFVTEKTADALRNLGFTNLEIRESGAIQ